jgi:hypothetical protein
VHRGLLAAMAEEQLSYLIMNFRSDKMCATGIPPAAVLTRLGLSEEGHAAPQVPPRENAEAVWKVTEAWDIEIWRQIHL